MSDSSFDGALDSSAVTAGLSGVCRPDLHLVDDACEGIEEAHAEIGARSEERAGLRTGVSGCCECWRVELSAR